LIHVIDGWTQRDGGASAYRSQDDLVELREGEKTDDLDPMSSIIRRT
jgi:hypothetical protein